MTTERVRVGVIGGGPAGLMAAEVMSAAGVAVHLFDAMPSVGRKFLLAGKGGLNLTHSEPADRFAERYGERRARIEALLESFNATDLRVWAAGLGIETFVGSSGRVFPKDLKAAPLLRAWLQRLRSPGGTEGKGVGVEFHMRHRWLGWARGGEALRFATPDGERLFACDAMVLALGGGSWARLGSNGAWVPLLAARGVAVAPLIPSNCGFDVAAYPRPEQALAEPAAHHALPIQVVPKPALRGWSDYFASRFAGQPFKSVAISCASAAGREFQRKGEFIATATGVEGSLIYAASSLLRDEISQRGFATLTLDLLPDVSADKVLAEVTHPRGSRSLSNHLKSRLKIQGIKAAVLHEILSRGDLQSPEKLAAAIKALPLQLVAARPMDEAISTAGGVLFEVLNTDLMLDVLPGVFCAGEMLDWEAPTGGYLLTASLASGRKAGQGVLAYLADIDR